MPSPPTPADVLDALRPIIDPDFGKSIVELGFVKNLRIDGGKVAFDIELTTPACPVKEEFQRQAKERVEDLPGVDAAEVTMTANTRSAGAPQSEALPGVKNVIAVASNKGGVGKSTIAVNVSVALARLGAGAGILDADITGPNIPTMLGIDQGLMAEGGAGLQTIEAHGIKAVSLGFVLPKGTPVVWRGPMIGSGVRQLLHDVDWGELDYLIVDIPPGTSDASMSMAQEAR